MSILHPLRDSRGRDPYRDIEGLFTRAGYERHDTAATCCTGECEQGRRCPLTPQPKPAPRIPRQHYTPPAGRPVIAFIVVALCAVLCAMGIANIASQVSL